MEKSGWVRYPDGFIVFGFFDEGGELREAILRFEEEGDFFRFMEGTDEFREAIERVDIPAAFREG